MTMMSSVIIKSFSGFTGLLQKRIGMKYVSLKQVKDTRTLLYTRR
jgi:hypothetical protein